jgi:hypothetical protein
MSNGDNRELQEKYNNCKLSYRVSYYFQRNTIYYAASLFPLKSNAFHRETKCSKTKVENSNVGHSFIMSY